LRSNYEISQEKNKLDLHQAAGGDHCHRGVHQSCHRWGVPLPLPESGRDTPGKNIIQYANYLVEDLGNPPQLQRAMEIAKASFLEIQYEGPEAQWSTSPGIPAIDDAHSHIFHEGDGIKIGKYRRHHLVQIKRGPHIVTFDLARSFQQEDTHKKLAILFVCCPLWYWQEHTFSCGLS